MSDRDPSSSPKSPSAAVTVSPLRCWSGAFVSATLSVLAYRLMSAIATTYANKPIASTNVTAVNIAAAVRTLVVGIVALGAGVFGFAALGLLALGIQTGIQRLRSPQSSRET